MEDPTRGMSREDALHHWGCANNPFKIDGTIRRLPKNLDTIDPRLVLVNEVGNILFMPPLLGVPCFGTPIVRTRFAGLRYFGKDGREHYYRCNTCKVAAACEKVVDARLRWHPTLSKRASEYREAHEAFTELDVAYRKAQFEKQQALQLQLSGPRTEARKKDTRTNTHFRRALLDFGSWVSSNDLVVVADHTGKDQRVRAQNAKHQRKSRRKAMANGIVPPEYVRSVHKERDRRRKVLTDYLAGMGAKGIYKTVDANRDASVWLWKQILRWERRSDSPGKIADALMRERVVTTANRDALRSKVRKSLVRIEKYETAGFLPDGSALWQPFDPEEGLE